MIRLVLALLLLPGLAFAAPAGNSGGPAAPGVGGGLTVGAPIAGTCANGYVLYSNSGVLGCEAVGGTVTVEW